MTVVRVIYSCHGVDLSLVRLIYAIADALGDSPLRTARIPHSFFLASLSFVLAFMLRIKDLGGRINGTGSEYLALEFLARRIKLLTLILLIPAMVDDAAITMVATPELSC